MSNFIKNLWKSINKAKKEKLLLVLLSAIIVFLACLVLLFIYTLPREAAVTYSDDSNTVRNTQIDSEKVEQSAASSPSPVSPTPAVSPSPSPTPSPTPEAEEPTFMKGSSSERDLLIKIVDGNGALINGTKFYLTFSYPGGEEYSFYSDTDGTCYLVRLEPGDYKVTMKPQKGFKTAEPISCTVKAKVEYIQIEDIDDIVDVTDASQIEQEVKTNEQTAEEIITPEELHTPEDLQDGLSVNYESSVDSVGNQLYTYEFDLSEDGYLLYEDGSKSDIIANVEDSMLVCGFRATDIPGYFETVELYNPDNTPVAGYAIRAYPVTTEIVKRIGWQKIDGKTYYYDENGDTVVGLKKIDGLLYYFNEYGVKASSLGIDVSFYNKEIDWQAVKRQGIDFAIVRVGGRGWETGLIYEDDCFNEYLQGAKLAGLKVGIYFYSTAINAFEAVQEASVALERLNGIGLDYPIYIDMEESGEYPNGRSDKLSAVQRTEIINAFCSTVQNSGYRAGVYSGQYFYQQSMNFSSISGYNIWLANYTSFSRVPSFSGRYDIWQFTDSGQIDGVSGFVDMNAIF